MEKAVREAKINTSWMNPSEAYETAVREFICDLFGPNGKEFVADVSRYVAQIADCGYVNSLAQLVLKTTLPGVPDFYRGTELWDFNLVDPDNRRPVDYNERRQRLDNLRKTAHVGDSDAARGVSQRWPGADVKLWITLRCLRARCDCADLFTFGEYIPLTVGGDLAEHVIGFARRLERESVVIIVPRHFYRLLSRGNKQQHESGPPRPEWGNTQIVVPNGFPQEYRCELSGQTLKAKGATDSRAFDVAELMQVFPVAVLKLRGN